MWTRYRKYLLVESGHPIKEAVDLAIARSQPDNDSLGVLIYEAHLADLMSSLLYAAGN